MNVNDGRIEEIRFFVLRLNDAGFIEAPRFVVLSREHQLTAIGAESDVSLLTRCISDAFGVTVFDRRRIDIATDHESNLFSIRTNRDLRDTVVQMEFLLAWSIPG